jgi:hypothetical protein
LAVKSGNVDTVEVLITFDEDIIRKNSETCLSWALGCCIPSGSRYTAVRRTVALLLRRGANPYAPMARHLSPPPHSLRIALTLFVRPARILL